MKSMLVTSVLGLGTQNSSREAKAHAGGGDRRGLKFEKNRTSLTL